MPTASPERKIYRVTEITRRIKDALERSFGSVWLEGELSNVRRPASGHLYFTIKDDKAQISAVMFRGDQIGLKFQPTDGVQVLVNGRVSVYERSGQYQVIVRQMEPGGQGALQAAFEKLKQRLAEEGLFDASRKRTLPVLPQRIGIVTSPTGAAVRDILKVLRQRQPNLHIIIAPARVQGDGAAREIAAQIEALNRRGDMDALIVGRGGGSLEDLWPFNEELVARAVAASTVPIVSAVGHEIDFTICDFVADVRAATPSHAAELLVERKDALEAALDATTRRMVAAMRHEVLETRARLTRAASSPALRDPAALVRSRKEHMQRLLLRMRHELLSGTRNTRSFLGDASLRMRHELQAGVRSTGQRLDELSLRSESAMRADTDRARQDVRRLAAQLRAMSPLAVLERGYSVTRTASGGIVRRVGDVRPGERVETQVADGRFAAEVVESDDS